MNNLKILRDEKNFSQEAIAKKLNIRQNNYSRYETEKRTMPISKVKEFAKYFKVSIDYLLGLTLIRSCFQSTGVKKKT